MPVILAISKAEIGRISVQGQSREIVHKTPYPKYQSKLKKKKATGH
jgi:hypothetical protein